MAEIARQLLDYLNLIDRFPERFQNQDASYQIITDVDEILSWQAQKRITLAQQNQPLEWAEIGIVYQDPYIVILRDLVEFPNKSRNSYIRLINHADLTGGQGAVVIPRLGQKIVLENRFRHATRRWHLEFPRGFGEPGVPADEQAKFEINEEIGGKVTSLRDLGVVFNNTGLEGNAVKVFFAELSETGRFSPIEAIKDLKIVTIDEFEKLIEGGKIDDGFTLSAYVLAKAAKLF